MALMVSTGLKPEVFLLGWGVKGLLVGMSVSGLEER
jgi:hypothetical protein